jgi:hypothetical protein
MNVEITRGRSDIYDILTHLTFILLNHIKYEIGFYWTMLVKYPVIGWNYNKPFLSKKIDTCRKEKAISHAANILEGLWGGVDIYDAFASDTARIVLHVIFWLEN